MLVTLAGIVTLVSLPWKANASEPIRATDRPLILDGIDTAPPGPVYAVMVIVPRFVV
jgi:hypothetical protein